MADCPQPVTKEFQPHGASNFAIMGQTPVSKFESGIMRVTKPTRRNTIVLSALASLGFLGCIAASAQYPQRQAPPPQRMAPPQQPPRRFGPNGMPMGGQNQERAGHLADWMNAHRDLTPQQQQQALQNEPGFRQLPPQTQERMRERLSQLNSMNPVQRERILNRNEQMERLSPDQRGQVRGAMQQLGSLPPDQRHAVARSFNELRNLPPNQREAAMGGIPLNDAQRATLNNLMRLEPMIPR